MKKYTFEFYQKYWQCGDGCCSDSWVNCEFLIDGKFECEYEEIRHLHDNKDRLEFVCEKLEDQEDDFLLEIKGNVEY
jgi:hypothetical protein